MKLKNKPTTKKMCITTKNKLVNLQIGLKNPQLHKIGRQKKYILSKINLGFKIANEKTYNFIDLYKNLYLQYFILFFIYRICLRL